MLVLSRKPGEKIYINDDIVITVLEIRGPKIRIGIEAPREVSITRSAHWIDTTADEQPTSS